MLAYLSRSLNRPAFSVVAMAVKHAGLGPRPGELPDPDKALRRPEGLAGLCADLRIETLLAAYEKGLYPSFQDGAHTWWAPAARMVSFPERITLPESVRRLLRTKRFAVTTDRDFEGVMRACAEPCPWRPARGAISPTLIDGFAALHEDGHAHSVEVWGRHGRLEGGLYGVAVGRVFFTEAIFARTRYAATTAFVTLSRHLRRSNFVLNAGKRMNGRLSKLGFTPVPRGAFNALLEEACREPGRGSLWGNDERAAVFD